MPKVTTYDVRSADPVLFYVAGEVGSVPTRDLSANDLARIAWIRLGPGRPSTPDAVTASAITALRDELVATGTYALSAVTEVSADE